MPPNSRSKTLPQLSEYLHARPIDFKVPKLELLTGVGWWAGMLGGGGLAYAFLDYQLGWSWIPSAAVAFFAVGGPLSVSIASAVKSKILSKAREQRKREAAIYDGHKKLFGYLFEGKLHRNIEAASAVLLEECARNWLRIQNSLQSPAWEADDSAHWSAMREQIASAANEAMDDIMYLLQGTFRPQPKRENWETTFRDVLEEWFGVEGPLNPTQPLTPEYAAARQTAQKLLELANQIDEIVRKRLTDNRSLNTSTSHSHLDFVLRELKDIHQAEEELRHQDA